MNWSEQYTADLKPDFSAISSYVESPWWDGLCGFVEKTYGVQPAVEYSRCSEAPGWNVKYKKSGRALCTLYPEKGSFTCLVCVGRKEAEAAELQMSSFHPRIRELYQATRLFNGSRWLMIPVDSEEMMKNTEDLILLRMRPPVRK